MYNKFEVTKIKYNINFFFFKENIKTFKHFFHCFQKELIKINHRNHIITKIWKTSLRLCLYLERISRMDGNSSSFQN